MKNIYEILKSFEITVPEDKKEDFDKALNAGCMINNYRPVTLAELIENNNKFRS